MKTTVASYAYVWICPICGEKQYRDLDHKFSIDKCCGSTSYKVKPPQKNKECKFTQGFVAACAITQRNHNCDSIVEDTLICCGPVSVDLYRKLGVDEFDIEALLPIIKEIKRKNTTKKKIKFRYPKGVSREPNTFLSSSGSNNQN